MIFHIKVSEKMLDVMRAKLAEQPELAGRVTPSLGPLESLGKFDLIFSLLAFHYQTGPVDQEIGWLAPLTIVWPFADKWSLIGKPRKPKVDLLVNEWFTNTCAILFFGFLGPGHGKPPKQETTNRLAHLLVNHPFANKWTFWFLDCLGFYTFGVLLAFHFQTHVLKLTSAIYSDPRVPKPYFPAQGCLKTGRGHV